MPARADARLPNGKVGDVGADEANLQALSERLSNHECKRIDSFLLLKDGKLILERYQNGYTPTKVHDIASITKSVTSLLIGIAIDRGHIPNVDQRVSEYFSNTRYRDAWPDDKRSITIRHLLTMQHGIECDDYADPNMKRFKKWLQSEDRIAAVLRLPMSCEPGKETKYCTASTQLLRRVIEEATKQSVESFAREVLFDPLEMKSFQWERSRRHGASMGFGAKASPRDLAVLGRMIEQSGEWNGQRLLSANWLRESFRRRGTLLNIDYGYLWYSEHYTVGGRNIQSRLALGHGGQFLILFHKLRSILVMTASDYSQEFDFYELIRNYVLPVCLKK